jgi:hypothetical protein
VTGRVCVVNPRTGAPFVRHRYQVVQLVSPSGEGELEVSARACARCFSLERALKCYVEDRFYAVSFTLDVDQVRALSEKLSSWLWSVEQ